MRFIPTSLVPKIYQTEPDSDVIKVKALTPSQDSQPPKFHPLPSGTLLRFVILTDSADKDRLKNTFSKKGKGEKIV